jgi:DNA-binding HxlR family transcriptional regulator
MNETHPDACCDGTPLGEFTCTVDVTLSVIGGKWKLLIYNQLRRGVTRFGQLRRAVPRITQTMLTQQLRELEADGIVTRTIYPEIPPRVEYALTDFGRTLECVIAVMAQWGEQYFATVVEQKRSASSAMSKLKAKARRSGESREEKATAAR